MIKKHIPETSKKSLTAVIFDSSDYIKRNILLALAADSVLDRDTLIEKAGGNPSAVLPRLTELELDGAVRTDIYGNYSLST